MPTATYRTIYDLVEDQMGYITAQQAADIAVSRMTLVMMANRGALERVSQGLYRLTSYPVHPLAQYMQATLWPYGQRGVLSHETALSLYEMSDVDPSRIHITVPTAYRIQRRVPGYLTVHHEDLPKADVTMLERIPITTPERAVRDSLNADLGPALIGQAIEDGMRSGRLSETSAAALRVELRQRGRPEHVDNVRTRTRQAPRVRRHPPGR